jgi:hypothetical protein
MPSFEPISGTISLNGSMRRPKRLRIHAETLRETTTSPSPKPYGSSPAFARRFGRASMRAGGGRKIRVAGAEVDHIDPRSSSARFRCGIVASGYREASEIASELRH